jgi:hypothetical protein
MLSEMEMRSCVFCVSADLHSGFSVCVCDPQSGGSAAHSFCHAASSNLFIGAPGLPLRIDACR